MAQQKKMKLKFQNAQRLTVPEAKALLVMASQMSDDYASQLHEKGDYDHAGGVSKEECQLALIGMRKMELAVQGTQEK